MIDPDKGVSRVSGFMMAGGGAILLSAILVFFTPISRNPAVYILGGLLCPVGIGLCAFALASGWRVAFSDPSKRPVERAQDVYIVAKIQFDENKDLVLDASPYDPSELDYFVQIQMPDGKTREFEAPHEVFEHIGEGMRGDIVYQGRWLSQFVFKPRKRNDVPTDPFSNSPQA